MTVKRDVLENRKKSQCSEQSKERRVEDNTVSWRVIFHL